MRPLPEDPARTMPCFARFFTTPPHEMILTTALCLLPAAAPLQQFVERPGVLPGPVVWSESVAAFDFDHDGDLDLFILNAQGYEVPGDYGAPSSAPLRPTMLVQTGRVAGVPVFQDRTDALIPAGIVVHGKSAAVCDVDGDGWEDLVLAVAFGDQQRLLRKDPNGPGFLDETDRLPSLVLNAFHVGWGDLDDDGDPDLVFADAGPNSFSAPGGLARLLLNDGNGQFTEAAERLPAIPKIGSQNAKIIDIDGDLDLDVVVDGKSSITQVYLNDGTANFALRTNLLPAATQANGGGAYETEWGDLDGDLDLDCLYMNFESGTFPVTDIAMRNRMDELGVPKMEAITDAFTGQNAQDENEFALLDADDDGDLDVLVAALTLGAPATTEKLFLNSGTMGPGFLTQVVGAFTTPPDSTLDLAVADFNGDGRYDVVTVNGEIPTSSFVNRYYENVGPADTTPPVIGRVRQLPSVLPVDALSGDTVIRAWIQDSVVDDGNAIVEADLRWLVQKGQSAIAGTVSMPHIGGYLHRAPLLPLAPSAGFIGATVKVSVAASDPQGNSSESLTQEFVVCGSAPYGASSGLQLAAIGTASPGGILRCEVTGGLPNSAAVLGLGRRPASIPSMMGTFHINPNFASRIPFVFDAQGSATIDVPISSGLTAGSPLFAQAFAGGGPVTVALSNGLEVAVCD